MFEYGFKTIELETGKSSIGRTYKKHMELSCVLQHREVGSHKTRFCTTNLADESPSFDNHGCTLMKKTCNGFYSQLSLEDTPVRCLNKAPFALSEMPEPNETGPPKNGSHCAVLFSDHRNGFKPTALVNGRVDNEMIVTWNGYHDTETNNTRPERTVGHGRPRCHSQPIRFRSLSESASEDHGNGQGLGINRAMNPEHFNTPRSCLTPDALEDASGFWMHKIPASKVDQDSFQQYRRRNSPSCNFSVSRRQLSGAVDQHQLHHPSHYEHRSFPLSKKEMETNFQEEIPVAHSENFVRQLEVVNENKFNIRSKRRHHNGASLEHAERILDFLGNNGPMASEDIASILQPDPKSQVNACLYDLHKNGYVKVTHNNPPLWSICDQFVRENPTNPGVIGEERKIETLFGRRSHCEEFSERPRRHSYNAYDNKPRKEPRTIEGSKPWMRCNGYSPIPGDRTNPYFCKLCKLPFPSEAQLDEHRRSTKHQNKLAKFNAVPYKKFCEYCKVHLNSESQAKEHFNSGRHDQTVAKSQKAPTKQHLPLVAVTQELNRDSSTRTEPCMYQLELYNKAMKTNAVCFLPTGTGNTLVAALVIAHMLKLNPSRQVVFLVDRVLLVLQQSDYLRKELSHLRVSDEASSNSFNGTRSIRIGAVCGEMRKLEGNARIYEQDVLIITADCYRNHLNNGTLRFDDVSLIVLDEAHHCNKDHPYNVIIRDFYLREDDLLGHRPKVLGLTASPAGELSLDKTTKRLQRLLGNLGDAKLLNVTNSAQELEEKTKKALPACILASFTQSEKGLKDVLVEYVTKAFNITVRLSEMKNYKDIFQPSSGGLFSIDDIHPVLCVIDNIVLSRPESSALSSLLHFQLICEAVCALQECGEKVALDHLVELAEEGLPHGFQWAEKNGLPSSQLWSYLEQYLGQGTPWRSEFEGIASGAEQLVQQLLKENWSGASGFSSGCVLVLVNRPRTAQYLANYLSNCLKLQLHNIRTTCSVSNGGSTDDEELMVLKQRELASRILDGSFQVVVATSEVQDYLDLPRCQLVVQMNPPGAAQTLQQMRSRGPLKDVRFACICRNDELPKKIEDLSRREENMRRAVRIINGL